MEEKKLRRSSSNRMIAGVCGGLAEYFGIDAVIVRVVFFLLFWSNLGGLLLYLILWLVMPEAEGGTVSDIPPSPPSDDGGAGVG